MDNKEATRISKFLSLVLRHKPETIGIALDDNGWVNVSELLYNWNAAKDNHITLDQLKYIVDNNDKKRFAFNEEGTKIRASQGHSTKINLNYKSIEPLEVLYHGTSETSLVHILKSGIQKMNRHHVHLSTDYATAINVGKRHGKPKVLIVHAKRMYEDGHLFYQSDNGVWLTNHIPPNYCEEVSC